jgi:DNA-binding NtrC family response regulator
MSKETLTIDQPGLPETLECAPRPTGALRGVVLVTAGSVTGRIIAVYGETPVTFGRSDECTVVLADAGISRVHAEIATLAGEYIVRDRGSTNGTFVNGERVGFATPLAHGDGVQLGTGTRMRFTLVDEAEEQALVRTYEALPREVERLRRASAEPAPSRPSSPGTGPMAVGGGSVVCDPAMRVLYEQAQRAAQAKISVLVLGETGVGKEVLARAIHQASPRVGKPFLALNCAALSETLLEAELFGHEKGAFTGAVQARPGVFEAADGGTVFLDEVGELPMSTQVKLLRVLEDRRVMRVGARTTREVDVRFLSATNRDLEREVTRGAFRQDLFFRLNGIALTIPPLRERTGEIEELASLFVAKACVESGRADAPIISPEVRRVLLGYPWPGNVRELRNVIERAVVLCAGPTLLPEHLPPKMLEAPAPRSGSTMHPPALRPAEPGSAPNAGSTMGLRPAEPGSAPNPAPEPPASEGSRSLRDRLTEVERQRIVDVLSQHGGNQTRAAVALGISRRTLVARLQEWGLTRSRRR